MDGAYLEGSSRASLKGELCHAIAKGGAALAKKRKLDQLGQPEVIEISSGHEDEEGDSHTGQH